VKSSNPQFQLIKVPVIQMPKVSQPVVPVKPNPAPHASIAPVQLPQPGQVSK